MSQASKLTLAGTSLFALSTVFFVHYYQQAEKSVRPPPPPALYLPFPHLPYLSAQAVQIQETDNQQAMHAGVIRDMEQQRVKKERQLDFDMQRALEEEYKKVQTVHDSSQILAKPR